VNSDDFFDQGGERPDIVAGRYRLPHPETGTEQSWTRATTHAELPEDSFALTRWQLRQLLIGLRQRPDLLRLIESWSADPGNDELDTVIKTAHEVAGNDAKANLGTAIHGVLQQVDRLWNEPAPGQNPDLDAWLQHVARVPEWAMPHARGYVAELRRHGLTPITTMIERRVINLALGCAGTLDNLYEEADGTVVLGDKKTGRLDYPERKYAIQLAVYQGADYLLDPDGGPPIDLRSVGLRREYAVLVHVDPESGACSIYRVDLRRAQYGANLATDVREWRRERHFLLPYVAPGVLPAELWRAAERAEGGRHLAAVPTSYRDPAVEEILGSNEVRRQRPDLFEADGTAIPAVPAVDGATRPGPNGGTQVYQLGEWMDDPGTFAVAGGLADPGNEHSANSTTASLGEALGYTMDELMKLPKAELQATLRRLDSGASVAHQRKILAEKILTLRAGGKVATSSPGAGKPAGRGAPDPAELPAGPATSAAEDPTDPRSPAFHRARLSEIAAAHTAGELGRIHAYVTRVGGDQAWTDGLTEAARARLAVLDPPDRRIEWRGEVIEPAAAVAAATSSQDMAQVWNLVTVGGSDESSWTPELNEAAHARLAAIQAAAEQQKPPNTPFGSPQ
jgi:hypothetical protein